MKTFLRFVVIEERQSTARWHRAKSPVSLLSDDEMAVVANVTEIAHDFFVKYGMQDESRNKNDE